MNKNRPSFLRSSSVFSDSLPIAVILSVVLSIAGDLLGELLFHVCKVTELFTRLSGDEDIGLFLAMYAVFIGIWIIFFLFAAVFKKNRPMLKAVGYHKNGNTFRGALIGLILGILTNGFCILMSALLGDIKLTFNSFRPFLLLGFLFVVLIQSGGEELIDRCYLYQKLRRRYRHPAVAIIGNAAAFSAMHLLNPGITFVSVLQIVIVGVIFSLFVYYFDCLWAAIMMHTGWNFTQSILFGLPNSGIVSKYSLFKLDAASARNGIFYNVNFGVEGSVGSLIVLVLLMVGLILLGRKNGERRDYWAEAE